MKAKTRFLATLWQPIRDAPLAKHPETSEPVWRIVIGGVGMAVSISDSKAEPPGIPTVHARER